MRKMKTLLALSAMVVFAAGVMSCGGPSSDDPTPTGPQTINLSVWGGEGTETQSFLKNVTDAFVTANETEDLKFNITIGAVSESDCKDRILEDVQSAADVFTFADDQFDDILAAGALQSVDVDPTIASDVKARNGAGSITAATSDNTLYAFPATASNGFFLYYDSSVLDLEDVSSYGNLLKACAEKSATSEDGYKYVISDQFDSGWYLDGWFRAAGLKADKDPTGKFTECDWNSEKGIEVAKSIMTLTCGEYADYFYNLADKSFQSDVAGNTSGKYRVVAGANGAWNAEVVKAAYGDGYAATKLPTFKVGGVETQRMSVAGFKLVGVSRFAENTGWALKLADFMTNEQNQTLRYTMVGEGPSNTKAADSEAVKADVALSALSQQSAYGSVQKVTGKFWGPDATLAAALYSGKNGDVDLVASGRGTANVTFNDAAVKTLLDTFVEAVETPVE